MPPEAAAHFRPVAAVESAVKTCPFVPTAKRAGVSAAVAAIKSPFASTIAFWIAFESSCATQEKSKSVADALANTCPVVPPLRSTNDVSMELPSVRIAAAPSLTRSVLSGVSHPKFVVVAIYATAPVACSHVSVLLSVFHVSAAFTWSQFIATSENSIGDMLIVKRIELSETPHLQPSTNP